MGANYIKAVGISDDEEISDRTTFVREEKPFAGYVRPADEEEAEGVKNRFDDIDKESLEVEKLEFNTEFFSPDKADPEKVLALINKNLQRIKK